MISQGQAIPAASLYQLTDNGIEAHATQALFANHKTVLFAVPGAFTPTCSDDHLPSYIIYADALKAKGVTQIICVSVNDPFVMKAWGKSQNTEALTLLADGSADFTKALGLEMDTGSFGGIRSQRYAMVIDDGVVSQLFVEEPEQYEVSSAQSVLAHL
ncbi:Peroxiredoxin [Vibrio stylophorae]|uniref:Glutathione-dependent peroxiredoxin n=1 Tax=Vibrio stylophorae TaxID=659351 RepID=A0ABM8ZXD1_9VIBR|nr:peroxiredoxin [Vibrio stylophorae]CAH0535414.1 Peroxiredoxin [Vibrio stylophorae]